MVLLPKTTNPISIRHVFGYKLGKRKLGRSASFLGATDLVTLYSPVICLLVQTLSTHQCGTTLNYARTVVFCFKNARITWDLPKLLLTLKHGF